MSDKAARDVLLDYAMELGDEDAVLLLRKREHGFEASFFDFCMALAREGVWREPITLVVERSLFWFLRDKLERAVTRDVPVEPPRMEYVRRSHFRAAAFLADSTPHLDVAESRWMLEAFEVRGPGGITIRVMS